MADRVCSVSDCDRQVKCRGWCSTHYNRWFRNGDPQVSLAVAVKNPGLACREPECERRASARGLCDSHYKRWRVAQTTCSITDCRRQVRGDGLCVPHLQRLRTYGDPLAGPPIRDRAPNGSPRSIHTSGGYRLVWAPEHAHAQANGYALEHKVVMAETLGRPLLSGENIHHVNGVKDDNRPGNLELWVTSQPSGQRPQDLVDWARVILDRYGTEVARG